MELLDQLEKRIEELLAKLSVLQDERITLEQQHGTALEALQFENTSLKEALLLEQQRNALAQERVEIILKRIEEQTEIL